MEGSLWLLQSGKASWRSWCLTGLEGQLERRDIPDRWSEVGLRGTQEVSGFLWSAGIPPESWNLFSAVVFVEESTAEGAGRSQHLGSGNHADSPPSPSGSSNRRAICWLCPRLALSPRLPLAPGLKQAR